MQVSTKTTAYIDGTELRDMIAEHLREKGVLPRDAKFTVRATVLDADGKTTAEVREPKDLRVTVEWPGEVAASRVVGRVRAC